MADGRGRVSALIFGHGDIIKEDVMTRAHRKQVSLAETPGYHCISRCVRRSFLSARSRLK
jgi:hypothetical protein